MAMPEGVMVNGWKSMIGIVCAGMILAASESPAYIPATNSDTSLMGSSADETGNSAQESTASDQEQARKHFQRGKEFQAKQNYTEAIKEHQKALELYPGFKPAQRALAWAQRDQQRQQLELSSGVSTLQTLVGRAQKLYHQGLAYEREQNLIEAAAAYKSALRLIPSYPEAQEGLQRVQTNAMRTMAPSASTSYKGRSRTEAPIPGSAPMATPAKESSGLQLDMLAKIKSQSQATNRSPSGQSDQVISSAIQKHFLTGSQALDRGDYATAIMEFELILEFMPNHNKTLYKLNIAKKRLAQDIKDAQNKVVSAKQQGDTMGEISAIRDIVHMDPNNPNARQAWEQAKKDNAGILDQLYRRGVNSYAQGNYPEALQAWELVLDLNPKHTKARESIRKVREKIELIR